MKVFPKILIVDNEADEIMELATAFSLARLPCLPLLYSGGFPTIEKLESSEQVRIIFCDINLTEITLSSQAGDDHSDATRVSPFIKDALDNVSGDGPFYLVFWSKHTDLAENIMKIFKEREQELASKIIDFSVMDKSKFKNDPVSLKAEVEGIIESNEFLSSIIAIENSVSVAVHEVINELFVEGGRDIEHLKSVFSLLANRSAGEINYKTRPYASLMEAITPLITNKFVKYEEEFDQLFKLSLKEYIEGKKVQLNGNIINRINTVISTDAVYHGENIPLIRGSFYSVTSEELNKLVRVPINNNQGVLVEELDGMVLKNHNFMALINSQFLDRQTWKIKNPEHLVAVDEYLKFGIIELSAACDQAQDNRPLHRFALSVLINKKLAGVSGFNFNPNNNAWKEITYSDAPLVVIDGETYAARISNKYVFALHDDYTVLQNKPFVRFSEQIVEQVLEFNARYGARRGIYKI
jgi:hypothetical protein